MGWQGLEQNKSKYARGQFLWPQRYGSKQFTITGAKKVAFNSCNRKTSDIVLKFNLTVISFFLVIFRFSNELQQVHNTGYRIIEYYNFRALRALNSSMKYNELLQQVRNRELQRNRGRLQYQYQTLMLSIQLHKV